jgi:hypothetical protein
MGPPTLIGNRRSTSRRCVNIHQITLEVGRIDVAGVLQGPLGRVGGDTQIRILERCLRLAILLGAFLCLFSFTLLLLLVVVVRATTSWRVTTRAAALPRLSVSCM